MTFFIRNTLVTGNAILAPMSGYSDMPFRSICRELGSAMSYTEFVPAPGINLGIESVLRRLWFTPSERPITFQIFGSDAEVLTQAAQRIEALQPDFIDLNMGCWADSVALHGAGAGLLCTPQKIGDIFKRLTRAVRIPVTGKIRLGWDDQSRNYLEVAKILEDNGAALIAVHGRTKVQGYKGNADWDAIGEVKAHVKIPVIGSGDVKCVADIARLKNHAGVDAVMIGRAAIGNPWIFAGKDEHEVTFADRAEMIHKHLVRSLEFYGAEFGFKFFHRHAHKYIHAIPNANALRYKLANAKSKDEVLETLEQYESVITN